MPLALRVIFLRFAGLTIKHEQFQIMGDPIFPNSGACPAVRP